jgi:AhpD family alkylhydroperoxidase
MENLMSRIQLVDPSTASGDARTLLDAVQAQLGATPNFIRVLANAPSALEGFLGFHGSLSAFSLDKVMQERIALAVAESNACRYCVSAHTATGVALNLFTNLIGKALEVDIDFPKVAVLDPAIRAAA